MIVIRVDTVVLQTLGVTLDITAGCVSDDFVYDMLLTPAAVATVSTPLSMVVVHCMCTFGCVTNTTVSLSARNHWHHEEKL